MPIPRGDRPTIRADATWTTGGARVPVGAMAPGGGAILGARLVEARGERRGTYRIE